MQEQLHQCLICQQHVIYQLQLLRDPSKWIVPHIIEIRLTGISRGGENLSAIPSLHLI